MKSVILVSTPPAQSGGVTVTLEGTSLILTIILSMTAILGGGIKLIGKFHDINNEIKDLRDDLNTHANAEGHAKLLEQTRLIQSNLTVLDKRFEIHLQDYINYKESNLLAWNGTKEAIKHNWEKTDRIFSEHKLEIKDLQKFLQKQGEFRIRE
jgi:hypothetical protein